VQDNFISYNNNEFCLKGSFPTGYYKDSYDVSVILKPNLY